MPYTEDEIRAFDGLRLYLRRREAEGARGEVIVAHGFGEHSGRYGPLIDHLISRGYSVTAYDHRGHGQSEGLPGHVDRFFDYEADLGKVISHTKSRYDPAKLFLIGHSMGGLVTLRYLAQSSSALLKAYAAKSKSGSLVNPNPLDRIAGAVISAPLLALAVQAPSHKLLIARIAALVAPRMRMDNEINPSVLSRDPEVGRAYAADPLVHRLVSARWFAEATRAMDEVIQQAEKITLPILVMHGTADKLASVEATISFCDKLGSADKEIVIYPNFYHELFNEPEKDEIYNRVSAWLDTHNH